MQQVTRHPDIPGPPSAVPPPPRPPAVEAEALILTSSELLKAKQLRGGLPPPPATDAPKPSSPCAARDSTHCWPTSRAEVFLGPGREGPTHPLGGWGARGVADLRGSILGSKIFFEVENRGNSRLRH